MSDESDLTIEETVALLREHAHTYEGDHPDAGRTLIHSRLGGIGADWDLDDAIALAERSTWRGWIDSILGHNLGIGVTDADKVRHYAFDVPKPPDEIARLREIAERLRDLGIPDEVLGLVDEWITEIEHATHV